MDTYSISLRQQNYRSRNLHSKCPVLWSMRQNRLHTPGKDFTNHHLASFSIRAASEISNLHLDFTFFKFLFLQSLLSLCSLSIAPHTYQYNHTSVSMYSRICTPMYTQHLNNFLASCTPLQTENYISTSKGFTQSCSRKSPTLY